MKNVLGTRGQLAVAFGELLQEMWLSRSPVVVPRAFKEVLGRFAPQFSGTAQQDAQEFLSYLLDGLHEDLNAAERHTYVEERAYDGLPADEAALHSWNFYKLHNNSIIVDMFQGQYRSTLRCLTCGRESVTFSPFMYLTLPLPSSGRVTLAECIEHFSRPERVGGADRWYCENCAAHREAFKRLEIWRTPAVLLVHLKRFSYRGPWREKLLTFVDFPLEYVAVTRCDAAGACARVGR